MPRSWLLPLLAALAMSVGWGYRGDYGHEAGAMMPGALVGLAVALAGGRPDWAERASLLGFLGAIGWAFGGQMSYGLLVGYTASDVMVDVAFGYGALFLVGALWGGIGAGVLAMGVTRPRAELEGFAVPLAALYAAWWLSYFTGLTDALQTRWPLNDTDWLPAAIALVVAGVSAAVWPGGRAACGLIVLLAAGWWAGFGLLSLGLGLRINPPRSDNWAGGLGLAAALALYLAGTRNRAGLWLMAVGLISGGVGFVLGDFANMLGRSNWGPIGRSETLGAMNSWKWMEQGFGLVMGLGVGLAFAVAARRLAPAEDTRVAAPVRLLAPLFLLLAVPWENFWKNVREWSEAGILRDGLFGIAAVWWCLLVGLTVSIPVAWAVVRARDGRLAMAPASSFGRAQLLFLMLLWMPALAALLQVMPGLQTRGALFVHVSFWLTAAACSLIVVGLDPPPPLEPTPADGPGSSVWRPLRACVALGLAAAVTIPGLAALTCAVRDGPLNGARYRFAPSGAETSPAPHNPLSPRPGADPP